MKEEDENETLKAFELETCACLDEHLINDEDDLINDEDTLIEDEGYLSVQAGEGVEIILDYATFGPENERNALQVSGRTIHNTMSTEFSSQHVQRKPHLGAASVELQTHEEGNTEDEPTFPLEPLHVTAWYSTQKVVTAQHQRELKSVWLLGSYIVDPVDVCHIDKGSYWHKCLALRDKKYAYRALHSHGFPDHDVLNELVQLFGRKSRLISTICDKICLHIREKNKCIVDVWAAFRVNGHNIIFVIIVTEMIRFSAKFEYSYVQRKIGDISTEAREVVDLRSLAEISPDAKKHLIKSINLVNVELMLNHKYLMMISGSSVRSKGYSNQSHVIMQETCIVLYVLVKDYIPIQEDPFESQYNGVPVDVRESCFQLFTGSASAYHANLKIGCQIHRENIGTLGGFIDYHGFGTCGITCAHVLLNPRDMSQLNSKTEDAMECGLSALKQTVYQPNNTQESHAIGKVLKAIYRQGGGGESGIDIAAIKIEHRYPNFGDFPDLQDGHPAGLHFDSGKTADYTGIQSGYVLKYGASTGLTYGSVVMDTSTLSVKTYPLYSLNKEYQIILHNLLEIQTIEGQPVFAGQGDSGALVFCKGENNELYCIGVVEGGTDHNTCVVMPIAPILQQFNLFTFKKFDKNRMYQHFETKLEERLGQLRSEITQTIDSKISLTEQLVSSGFESVFRQLNRIEQNMQPNQNN